MKDLANEATEVGTHWYMFGSGSTRVLRFDRSGNLWVREYQPRRVESASWQVFAPAGAILGCLDFPDSVELLDVGQDWILTRARDELDVERVVLYGLEPPSAAGSMAKTRKSPTCPIGA